MRLSYGKPPQQLQDSQESAEDDNPPLPTARNLRFSRRIQPRDGSKWHWKFVGAVLEHRAKHPNKIGHMTTIVLTRTDALYHVTDHKATNDDDFVYEFHDL